MFNKSRKKIVLVILTMTILFLLVTLAAIYITSFLSLKNQSKEMLQRYVDRFSLEAAPRSDHLADLPDLEPQRNDKLKPADSVLYQLSSFYSVAFSEEGEILSVDTGWGKVHPEDEIIAFAQDILAQNKHEGTYEHMIFRVEQQDGYTLVAFMDTLIMDDSMRTVLFNTLIIGAVSVMIVFAVSELLAKQIIRPLEENDCRQKQFISDAGHELKTPISVVNTNVEILSRQIGENQWLSNIQYENERMANLIKDLLMLSRAENSTFISEDINLSKLVQQEVLPFESVAFEHGIELISSISEGVAIKGNCSQLSQLISILTDNAISYSEGGKRVTISLKKTHRHAVITICNVGKEIPEEIKARLFDRFYRIDESRGETEGHFGLGLPIAKAITEAHHGRIHVECKEGSVIFTVSLPLEN